jgi:hypothetical protein
MKLAFAMAALATALFSTPASAQHFTDASPDVRPIVTTDPASYMQDFGQHIAAHGMAPIRDVTTAMFNGEVSPQMNQIMLFYDGYIGHEPARSWSVIDDVTLSDHVRMIFALFVFSSHQFLFTRTDFIRVDNSNWSMNGVSFGSNWSQVAVTLSPGFTETPKPQ